MRVQELVNGFVVTCEPAAASLADIDRPIEALVVLDPAEFRDGI